MATDDPVYLDHNATTPVAPEVLEAMLPFVREHFGNPSSGHVFGRRAKDAVADARARVAEAIGARPSEIVFTSGGTEANNWVVRRTAEARPRGRRLVTSAVEHPSVMEPCRRLAEAGWDVDLGAVDDRGCVRAGEIARRIDGRTALVTIMLANNETGAIQTVAELASTTRSAGALSHTDAAQALGKIPIRVDELGVDLMTLVGHKVYAPKGIGALYVRDGVDLGPWLLGGGQERGLRPGTENVASIVGFGAACALVTERLAEDARRMRRLRDSLWERLLAGIDALALNGDPDGSLPNTLSVRFPGVAGSAVLAAAPAVAASTGSACHEEREDPSGVLVAMGVPRDTARGTVRLSVGRATTEADVARAADALVAAWRRVR